MSSTHPTSSISSSPGDFDCPSIEVRRSLYEVKHPNSSITIDGSIDLDTRFFRSHHGSRPFCITLALTKPGSLRPLDWQQEGPNVPRNPRSSIHLGGRITIDGELCCLNYTIDVPASLLPCPGDRRTFGVAVKAFEVGNPRVVTQTNVAQFVVNHRANKVGLRITPITAFGAMRRFSREARIGAAMDYVTPREVRRASLRRGSISR